jgi:hypothetical protein
VFVVHVPAQELLAQHPAAVSVAVFFGVALMPRV